MRRARLAGALAGSAGLGFLGFCILLDAAAGPPGPLPPPEPPPAGRPFRVAVLGDVQKGITNFRNLLATLRAESPAFYLQTGDLVSDDDEGHYRLVGAVLRGSGIPAPAVVPGNHDVKRGPQRFVRSFGALEKSFVVGGVAWVLLDNSTGAPPDPRHVEERIAAAGPHETLVLAMHVPPFDAKGAPLPEYGPFLEWLGKGKAAYLLCGHVHAYLRIPVGKTVVIANGIGGDSDAGRYDQKVFATVIEVDGVLLKDRKVEIAPEQGLWDHARHFAIGHVREGYRSRPIPMFLLTLAAGALGGWGARGLKKAA
jgi:hypothetical protein